MAGGPSLPEVRGLTRPPSFARHWCPRNRAPCPAEGLKVRDGDTLWARVESPFWHYTGEPMIRLWKVDCPEIFSPHSPEEYALGMKAKAFTESVVLGQQIALVAGVPETDDHDRFVAAVIYRGARDVQFDLGTELIRRRLTKADVPAFAAATDAERAAWGTV